MRENEDYILNYAALLACIVSELSVDKAIKQIMLQTDYINNSKRVANCKKLGKTRSIPVKVTNVITGEVEVYASNVEATKELGLYKTVVSNYIKNKMIYKGMYRFERVECRQD